MNADTTGGFGARRLIKVIAPFVVPVLTGTCGFVAASIPPKGRYYKHSMQEITPSWGYSFKLGVGLFLTGTMAESKRSGLCQKS